MAEQPNGWDWFETGEAPSGAQMERLAALAARCFCGADGAAFLDYLRALTTERALGPATSNRMLRHLEGQRQLVAHIGSLVSRGRGGVPTTPKMRNGADHD